ncbi:unnamed protein product [Caenorhabditis brenneri]
MGPKNGAISTDQEDICLQSMNKNREADTNKTDQEIGNQIQLRVYKHRWIVWLTVPLRNTYVMDRVCTVWKLCQRLLRREKCCLHKTNLAIERLPSSLKW